MVKRITTLLVVCLFISACSFAVSQPTQTSTVQATLPPPSATLSPTPAPPTTTPTPAPTDTSVPTVTATPVAYGPGNYPASVDPLTGLTVADPALLTRRPVSVKVQIFPRGQRPPWGITSADIVYDYYQNGGMTRFHAIFYGNNAEQVGPIRSGRLFDSQIVAMYKSILAFGGADKRILNTFFNSSFGNRLVFEGSNNCPPMCRIDPNGFNYLVANTAELTKYAQTKGISNEKQIQEGMSFNSSVPEGGQPGVQVFVRFSISAYTRWDYDASTGRYLRFQDTQEDTGGAGEVYTAMTDRLTNQQIAADNVIVLQLPHQYAFNTKPGPGEIIDITLTGSGTGFAFRDGQFYTVLWNRPAKDSVLYLTLPDGKPFQYKPGSTWYEVIGLSSKVEQPGAGIWRYLFAIP